MDQWAKLFTIGRHQVLVMVEYDEEHDFYELIQITRVYGVRVELKLSFREEWVAQGALHDYGEDNARVFLQRMQRVHQGMGMKGGENGE